MASIKWKNFCLVFITSKAKNNYLTTTDRFYDSNLTIDFVKFEYFFSLEGLDKYFDLRKGDNYEIVYCIEGLSWHNICGQFSLSMIDISGGSNNKNTYFHHINLDNLFF